MSRSPRQSSAGEASGRVRLLEGAALACILAVMVARPFATEMPFRTPEVLFTKSTQPAGPSGELMRVTFAMILLGAVCLWAAGQALRRQARIAAPGFAIAIVLFAACSLASALASADKRGALDGWIEQVAILLAAWAAMQLLRRRGWGLVAVVLVGLGAAMAWRAIDQVIWQIPARTAQFRADPEKALAQQDVAPGSPRARMLETRLSDPAATGYSGLANVFASLLIVLTAAAAAVAVDKLAEGLRSRKERPPPRGQVHLPTLAGVISIAFGALPPAGLALTRSKGGIGVAVLGAIGAVVLMLRTDFWARHRRKLLAAAAALVVAMCVLVAVAGRRGPLPGRSLQVRWEYWVGAARMVRESPLRGAGPGNFGYSYLKYRLDAAAESTKSAHNVLLDAACSYGLPAAALYLGLLVWMVLAVTRPAAGPEPPTAGQPDRDRPAVLRIVFLTGAVLGVLVVWGQPAGSASLFAEAVLPAAIFAVALLASTWAGRTLERPYEGGRLGRIALGAGLVAFLLHNLVSYTLLSPATATVFWIAAAAMAAPAVAGRAPKLTRRLSVALAAAAVVALIAAGIWLWRPVYRRTSQLRLAHAAFLRGGIRATEVHLRAAVAADTLDGLAPGYVATMKLAALWVDRPEVMRAVIADGIEFAELTYQRSPRSLSALVLARALWRDPQQRDRALRMGERALEMDPKNIRQRWEYADMLAAAGRLDDALWHTAEVRRIDKTRPADSDFRLTDEELARLDAFERQIKSRKGR